jgi:hypothetical protein
MRAVERRQQESGHAIGHGIGMPPQAEAMVGVPTAGLSSATSRSLHPVRWRRRHVGMMQASIVARSAGNASYAITPR